MDEALVARGREILAKFDIDKKRRQLRELEARSLREDFWQDSQAAAAVMKQISSLSREIAEIELFELTLTEGTEEQARAEIDRLEFALFLSGPYDQGDAIVSIHAGQGGTEAMDWTSMLNRMYLRFAQRRGWTAEEIDYTPGDEAGIKSITHQVSGAYAYGFLKAEAGVHRLVRQSPFNADNLRQTSFAMVEVMPVFADTAGIELKEEELEWDFYRSGGKGGQNVNKVSTAVRLKHKPTGIVVASQAQRYQGQNREYALTMLRAKLWALAEAARQRTVSSVKGEYKTPGWGNQIRSYVLHPYHLVKDLRTQYETSHTDLVLDGELDDFILAYLKKFS